MIITILCGGLLLSTFVIPTLLSSPNMKADSRGGDTSITRQLKYVLGDPLAYICVLWKNVSGRFIDDVSGSWLSLFAYIGRYPYTELFLTLLVGTALTDTYTMHKKEYCIKEKLTAAVSILLTIILIWTALYLSFSEVGETVITGVQGRYYFPFLFLIYLCLRNRKIVNKMKLEKYQVMLMILTISLVLYIIYTVILLQKFV